MHKPPTVVLDIDPAMGYNRAVLRGIAQYANLHGPWLLKRDFLLYKVKEKYGPKQGVRDAKGVIVDVTGKTVPKWIPDGVPTVVLPLKAKIPGFPNICDDDAAIGKMAAEHLLECGYRNFAFCGFKDMHWSRDRFLGFRDRVNKADHEVQCFQRTSSQFCGLWDKKENDLSVWLESLTRPTGLMACNDDCSLFVLEACSIAGLKVPYDVAIIGVDNNDLICELSEPPLSSIALNAAKSGYKAAELLDLMMSGRKKMTEMMIVTEPTHVVGRQSTSAILVDNPDVAEALFFIRQNARRKITVDDVVNAVGLSRRELYRCFRRNLGHSIYQEIVRARVELLTRMLMESNYTVSQIAYSMGETSEKNLSRYFRKIKGLSPLAYRRRYANKYHANLPAPDNRQKTI